MTVALQSALPDEVPELFDVLVIAGVESPGLCTVESSRPFDWDVKKGKGSSGATSTYQGKGLAKVKVTLRLWKDYETGVDHYGDYLTRFLPVLFDVTQDSKPQAVDVYHPYLAALGISSCTVEEISTPKNNGQGVREVQIDLLEFRQPRPAGGTPGGSKSKKDAPGNNAGAQLANAVLEDESYAEKAGKAAANAIDAFLDTLE